MAVPVVVAKELLLQNRSGTEQPTTSYTLDEWSRFQTELQYQWTTHVPAKPPLQIQGDLEVDMRVMAYGGFGLYGGGGIVLKISDPENVIERLCDSVSASLSDISVDVDFIHWSNAIQVTGLYRAGDRYEFYKVCNALVSSELMSDAVKAGQFKMSIKFK